MSGTLVRRLSSTAKRFVHAANASRSNPSRAARILWWELAERSDRAYRQARRQLRAGASHAHSGGPARYEGYERRAEVMRSVDGGAVDIVLVLAHNPVGVANEVADTGPSATIHLLTVRPLRSRQQSRLRSNISYRACATLDQRVEYLSTHPQPQVLIEHGPNHSHQKVRSFRELMPFVAPGGAYLVEALTAVHPADAGSAVADATVLALLRRLDSLRNGLGRDEARSSTLELADSLACIDFHAGVAVASKAVAHRFSLRDSTANAILDARYGRSWGSVVTSLPPARCRSRARLFAHGDGPITERSVIDVPERYLRRYETAHCWSRQRLRYGDHWLPDTYRHPMEEVLTHKALVRCTRHMARPVPGKVPDGPTRSAAGPFFYFDTEYPGHFGHVTTEVVSRYWGWLLAREAEPGIRPLISLSRSQQAIPGYQRQIFTALGIDHDSIEYIRWNECVEVDRLYAASPGFVFPHYVAPELADVWDRVRRGCERPDLPPSPERLFVSRRPRGIRTCINGSEVEEMFVRHGFEVIYPEDHDFAEQVTMFHRAKIIAGFGGSGMFNSMFAPDTTVIVVSGEGYTASNEYLIKSVVGGDIHYFWGDSLIKQPIGGWTWEAYQSNFTVDVERYEPEIARLVKQEADPEVS